MIIRIIIFTLCIANSPVFSGNQWNNYLDNDLKRARTELAAKSLLWAGGWFSSMYILSYEDEYLNTAVKSLYNGNFKHYFDTVDYLGDGSYSIPAAIGFAGFTHLFNDHKLRQAALTSIEAVLASSILVYSLKITFGRKRPLENRGAHSFQPFSGWDDSFPSGHTSTAFALITPFVYYYDNLIGYFLLLFPASTAISRMILDKHWATDVLTGGAIGFVVGFYLSKWHRDFSRTNSGNSLSPPMMISFSIPLGR